jgi:hypothetical protein
MHPFHSTVFVPLYSPFLQTHKQSSRVRQELFGHYYPSFSCYSSSRRRPRQTWTFHESLNKHTMHNYCRNVMESPRLLSRMHGNKERLECRHPKGSRDNGSHLCCLYTGMYILRHIPSSLQSVCTEATTTMQLIDYI